MKHTVESEFKMMRYGKMGENLMHWAGAQAAVVAYKCLVSLKSVYLSFLYVASRLVSVLQMSSLSAVPVDGVEND